MSFTLTQSCAIAKSSTAKIARSSNKSVSRRRGQQLVVKAEETSTSGTCFSRFCFFSIVSTQIWSVYDRFTSARKEISLGKILLRQTWVSFVSRVWSVFLDTVRWFRVGEKRKKQRRNPKSLTRASSLSLSL